MAKEKQEANSQSQVSQMLQSPKLQGSDNAKGRKNKVLFGLLAFFTALVIMLVVVGGAFYIIVHNNVNGITDKYRKNIQEVKVLRWALPKAKDPEDPKYLSADEITKKYQELRVKRDELTKQLEDANKKNEELQKVKDDQDKAKAEAEKILKDAQTLNEEVETKKKQLNEDKQKLDQFIANGDKSGFKDYFEKVNKETAEKIYSEIIKEQKANEDVKKFIQIYESMDPAATAKILEEMGNTKIDLIVDIAKNMKKDVAAEVLAAMDPVLASKVTEKLSKVYMNGAVKAQ